MKGKGRQLGPSVLRWLGAPHWGQRVGSLDAAEVPGLEGRVYERELEAEKCVFVRPRGRPLLPLFAEHQWPEMRTLIFIGASALALPDLQGFH